MKRVNIAAPQFEYDAEDPQGFRAGMARLGKLLGAKESDSDKVGIWTGDPETDVMVRRESNVDYFDGEA